MKGQQMFANKSGVYKKKVFSLIGCLGSTIQQQTKAPENP